jgi:hypothetical protein
MVNKEEIEKLERLAKLIRYYIILSPISNL